jgi:DNA-binding NarL/FixJ family response regulator
VAKRAQKKNGLANLDAMLSAAMNAVPRSGDLEPQPQGNGDLVEVKRQLLADLCRLLGQRINGEVLESTASSSSPHPITPPGQALPDLSPRMRQTLDRLLVGDSEKQIANHLGLSRHTVHVYVKAIYKGFGVSSRGELLSKFVRAPIYKNEV